MRQNTSPANPRLYNLRVASRYYSGQIASASRQLDMSLMYGKEKEDETGTLSFLSLCLWAYSFKILLIPVLYRFSTSFPQSRQISMAPSGSSSGKPVTKTSTVRTALMHFLSHDTYITPILFSSISVQSRGVYLVLLSDPQLRLPF